MNLADTKITMFKQITIYITLLFGLPAFAMAEEYNQPSHWFKQLSDFELSGPVSEMTKIKGDLHPATMVFNQHGQMVSQYHNPDIGRSEHIGAGENVVCQFSGSRFESCIAGGGNILENPSLAANRIAVAKTDQAGVKVVVMENVLSRTSVTVSQSKTLFAYTYLGESYKQTVYATNGRKGPVDLYEYKDGRLATVLRIVGTDAAGKIQFSERENYRYENGRLAEAVKLLTRETFRYNKQGERSYLRMEGAKTGALLEETVYSDYQYDNCGNWIARTEKRVTYVGDADEGSVYGLNGEKVESPSDAPGFPAAHTQKVTREIDYYQECGLTPVQ